MGDSLDEIKNTVNEYMVQGKIAIFVGAGVSKLSGYPSWAELIEKMAKAIKYPPTLKDSHGNDAFSSDEYLKIPQIYFKNKGENAYKAYVRKKLHIKKEPNEIHKLIMKLKPNHILTTNYDTLIEQTANMAGIAYSVINSDNKVGTVPTQNYILKVHGDFETNNFVLKEEDYLDYEKNFRLIDNLMKTILSTHLVIFVGYGLGDYNIKLILNWVKKAQQDNFNEPIFIYTGNKKLSDVELSYYEGEKLRVLDSNRLVEDADTATFLERYSKALSFLIEPYKDEVRFRNNVWTINYFFKTIEPLKDMAYLRIEDMAKLFPKSEIWFTNELRYDEFSYLFKAYKVYLKGTVLSGKQKKQMNDVIARLRNSGVESITNLSGHGDKDFSSEISTGLSIRSDTFDLSYQEILNRIEKYPDDIESQFKKAYDLFWVGRLNSAMDLYYSLIPDCYTNKKWILYFLSQINLYYIRQIIIKLDRDLSSIWGALVFGKPGSLWDEAEIYELKLSHLVADIPIEIRRYSFLQKLTDKNYYKDDFVRLYQENYDIEKDIISGTFTSAGQPKDLTAKIRIYDAINFVYGNRIAFDKFAEHKNFTKIALKQRFKGMLNQNKLASEHSLGKLDKKSYIDFQEVLLIVRTFNYDDISVFYEKENGHQLILKRDSVNKFENYLQNLMLYFKEHFLKKMEGETILEYLMLRGEIKNALFLASYYAENEIVCSECANYLCTCLPADELDIHKQKPILERLKDKLSNKSIIKNLLETVIIGDIKRYNSGEDNYISLYKNETAIKADMLKTWFPEYKSALLSEAITKSRKKVADEMRPILEDII